MAPASSNSWRRPTAHVLVGAVLPLLVAAVLVMASGQGLSWPASPVARDQMAGALLVLDTLLLVFGCSVALPGRRTTLVAAGSLAGSALTVSRVLATGPVMPWIVAHAVLATAAAAALAARACAARFMPRPLDASGLTGLIALVATAGLLAVGPATPVPPAWLVDALLRVNPAIAVSSAAGIDPLRTEPLYTLSPVAHWAFVYPGISASVALYSVVALTCIAGGILRASLSRTSR